MLLPVRPDLLLTISPARAACGVARDIHRAGAIT